MLDTLTYPNSHSSLISAFSGYGMVPPDYTEKEGAPEALLLFHDFDAAPEL